MKCIWKGNYNDIKIRCNFDMCKRISQDVRILWCADGRRDVWKIGEILNFIKRIKEERVS